MVEKSQKEELKAIQQLSESRQKILEEITRVIVGQEQVIEEILISLFSQSHCLIVGVPGLAKTLLVKTIARLLDLKFKRIQFTPDLMPADITGTEIIEEDKSSGQRNFRFVQGPIFANIVLADEINRTPPKTQAALLEAMQEHKVTTGGISHDLPIPFFVLATENPIEQEGTYPLPEAQLDRFMFNIMIDYPTKEQEKQIVERTGIGEVSLSPVLSGQDIIALQKIIHQVPISEHVVSYAVALTRATRPRDPEAPEFVRNWVNWGVGPRAAQYLAIAGKARAIMNGQYSVSCEDIRMVAYPVFRHRIVISYNAETEGITSTDIIAKLLETVPEPSYKK